MKVAPARRPRILHLAYEDPRAPGSGGGAIRTREVCSRMSGFDIDIVTHAYPGARPRRRGDVRWSHAGLAVASRLLQVASYYCSLPAIVLGRSYDLLVEDFAPPCTFAFTPALSRAPVIAVVQWLFARQMAEKYGVPVGCFENAGLRLYRNFIVMSESMRREIRERVHGAEVCVAGCGVDEELFETTPRDEGWALFLGRLDSHQKGLDLLLEAVARQPDPAFRLKIVGDGPDDRRLRDLTTRLGIGDRVRFLGRVTGPRKAALLAGARLLCMPSRYETFGMVAAEAMACGTPVLASDLPCLRELVRPETGVLVPPGRTQEFADALTGLWGDPGRCRRLGVAARATVRHLQWQSIAERQAGFYGSVLRFRPQPAMTPDRRPAT
jgi:glycosyltransferase involved in cell wall biosynthesis